MHLRHLLHAWLAVCSYAWLAVCSYVAAFHAGSKHSCMRISTAAHPLQSTGAACYSPAWHRCIDTVLPNLGQSQGWRLSLGLAGVPACALLLGGLLLPESPNSLIER